MLASELYHTALSHTWSVESFSLALYAPKMRHLMLQRGLGANEFQTRGSRTDITFLVCPLP